MDHNADKRAIEARTMALSSKHVVLGQAICLILGCMLMMAYTGVHPISALLAWFAVQVFLASMPIITNRLYLARPQRDEEPFWRLRHIWGVRFNALIWGIWGYWLVNGAPEDLRLMTIMVFACMVAGALPIIGAIKEAMYGYAVLMLLPLIISCLSWKTRVDPHLLLICVTFLLFMLRSARIYNDIIIEAITLEVRQARMVDDLRKARRAAEDASRAKSEFIANVSHEIRTPLNGIIGMTHLLGRSALNDQQREEVEVIRTSSDLLLSLVNDVLDISKIEAGRLQVQSQPFVPRRMLEEVVRMFQGEAQRKLLMLELVTEGDMPQCLMGDSLRLRQVLVNLLGNAIKFTERGEVVLHVQAGRTSLGWRIGFAVRDTGIGIAKARQDDIFKAFVQADGTLTRKYGGTGLGLAIANHLVTMLGGQLRVESEPGKGSEFRFELELPEGALSEMTSAQQEDEHVAPKRVLLAEDNPTNRLVATRLLQKLGHDVLVAENGIVALEMLNAEKIDLILMDMQMPEMDGLEATRRIRASEVQTGHPRMPIVALTANAMGSDREACLAAGMDAFLTKPVHPEELKAVLAHVSP